MVVAIDLTTLATSEDSGGYAYWINREFELGIAEPELAQLTTFHEFAALPQARGFFARARLEPALSQQIEEVIDHVDPLHPVLLRSLLPREHAIAGVQALAAEHQILYLTRRPRTREDITRAWLKRYEFPYAERLYMCQSEAEKWLHATHEAEPDEAILLIDSQVAPMLMAYRQFCQYLPDQARWSRGRVALLAFSQAPESWKSATPVPVYPFSAWNALPTIRATASI